MRIFLTFLFFGFTTAIYAQQTEIIWQSLKSQNFGKSLWFDYATFQINGKGIPSFCSQYFSNSAGQVSLQNEIFQPVSKEELQIVLRSGFEVPEEIEIKQTLTNSGDDFVVSYCFIPLRRNRASGEIEKLISFNLDLDDSPTDFFNKTSGAQQADTNALAQGNWYKLGVTKTGVYKITPQFLADCGFSVSNLPSANLRVLGNGAGMLPEANNLNPDPGLKEVSIYVNDGGDGIFNGNDYALFYARGPHVWKYNGSNDRYAHDYNVYSETSHYFITIDNGVGKRIQPVGYAPNSANYTVSSFDALAFVEEENLNLAGCGRRWFGQVYDFNIKHTYEFQIPNVAIGDTAFIKTSSAALASNNSTRMEYYIGGKKVSEDTFSTPFGDDVFADDVNFTPFVPSSGNLNVETVFNKASNTSATAWMDYIELHVRSNMLMSGTSLIFRDRNAYKEQGAAEYVLQNVNNNQFLVWDVTNHIVPRAVNGNLVNSTYTFKAPSDSLRTFVAIAGSNFPLPLKTGSVPNQNLMSLRDVDMVIVAHPNFVSQAQDLAQFHNDLDGLNSVVVTPEQIYNEFSSGMQDITGIKLFLRNLYKKSQNRTVEYLLLFGDASYDYKNRMPNMHNFVPNYQAQNSSSLSGSTCTDDYFGYLDDNEGVLMLSESLDLAIGRLPVKTKQEADVALQKIANYATQPATFGDWRNRAILLADDVDEGWERQFVERLDALGKELDTTAPFLNIEKIYIDSYSQEVKAGSQRYPSAREDLYRKVKRGNLVTSYLGHGGEVGWATERVLQLTDINSWDNFDNMPLFITVTCEFSRVDDPTRVSAGEQLFLNPNGGAISLISTMRPVYATESTYNINNTLMEYLFFEQNGKFLSMGEAIRATKNSNNSSDRLRFALLGDPALKLAIPKHSVMTDSINGIAASNFSDTLKALSKVKIHGHLENESGDLLSTFNGTVYPTVYDKKNNRSTLANDGKGAPFTYQSQENVIFRGNSSVVNGEFSFEFVVPLDINLVIGEGKISYYATDQATDANGYNKDIRVGGLDTSVAFDDIGPLVRVFINDTNFIDGGLTDRDPVSLALISDSSGINTVGSGIGHDIIGILDGNTSQPYILNDYFTSDLNSFQSGSLAFPFFGLQPGSHQLRIRAWDVNNNPGEGSITFVVDASHELALNRVMNFPNPFREQTTFQFEHNRAGESLFVEVNIFNQYGAMVKQIEQNVVSQGNRVSTITWDGRGQDGNLLGSGVFVYQVKVRSTEDGSESTEFSKLVYIK